MTTPQQRVLDLVAKGVVSPADQAVLLQELEDRCEHAGLWPLLTDPFERFGGAPAAAAGIVLAGASILVARLGLRFDGFLDLHPVPAPVALTTAVVDPLAGLLLPAVVAWGLGRGLAGRGRLVDALGVVGLARGPGLLLGPVLALIRRQTGPTLASPPPSFSLALGAIVLISLLTIGGQLWLLVAGMRNTTGLHGQRLALATGLLVVLGELLSKAALHVTMAAL